MTEHELTARRVDEETPGRFLRHARRAADLSQAQLAQRVGVSAQRISDLERGVATNISIKTAIALADTLGLSLDAWLRPAKEQHDDKAAGSRMGGVPY